MVVVSIGLVTFVYLSNRWRFNIEKITFHDGSFYEEGLELDMYFQKRIELTDVKKSAKVNDIDNLNSTRNLKAVDVKDIKTNENILILGENKTKDNKEIDKDVLTTITPCKQNNVENPVITEYKTITYKDYQKIPPQKLLKYDKRNLIRYFKDELIHNNCIVKLFTKHSLIDTRVISTLKLLFKVNVIFGLNALSITDSMIESRSLSATRVYIYI
jgi:hypothetical protein